MTWRLRTRLLSAMRGTSGTLRHTKRSRYRCSLPGLAGFAGLRRTEPEVPRIGSRSIRKRLQMKSSTATGAKKEKGHEVVHPFELPTEKAARPKNGRPLQNQPRKRIT